VGWNSASGRDKHVEQLGPHVSAVSPFESVEMLSLQPAGPGKQCRSPGARRCSAGSLAADD